MSGEKRREQERRDMQRAADKEEADKIKSVLSVRVNRLPDDVRSMRVQEIEAFKLWCIETRAQLKRARPDVIELRRLLAKSNHYYGE